MKTIIITIICLAYSLTNYAQTLWVTSGANIINNNAGGSVLVRQDATNAASVPSWGNWALFSHGSTSHTSGTATKVWGAYLLSLNHKSGILNESIGGNLTAGNESSGTGTVNNAYGLWTRVQAGLGTVNNGYGVYIFNTAAVNDYGLYQAGADDDNYFAGNVGIGTLTTGSFKLAVEGKIGAREIQVTTASPWPDYVFESDYHLPSLAEVKRFIRANKHLPDVPSATNVKENGYNLSEMDALLLRKIEEMTLYMLEQQEEIEALREQVKSLTSKK